MPQLRLRQVGARGATAHDQVVRSRAPARSCSLVEQHLLATGVPCVNGIARPRFARRREEGSAVLVHEQVAWYSEAVDTAVSSHCEACERLR